MVSFYCLLAEQLEHFPWMQKNLLHFLLHPAVISACYRQGVDADFKFHFPISNINVMWGWKEESGSELMLTIVNDVPSTLCE